MNNFHGVTLYWASYKINDVIKMAAAEILKIYDISVIYGPILIFYDLNERKLEILLKRLLPYGVFPKLNIFRDIPTNVPRILKKYTFVEIP